MMPIPPERICDGRLSPIRDMMAGRPSDTRVTINATTAYITSGVRHCDIAMKQGKPARHNRL